MPGILAHGFDLSLRAPNSVAKGPAPSRDLDQEARVGRYTARDRGVSIQIPNARSKLNSDTSEDAS
jgi:hypothetical protein